MKKFLTIAFTVATLLAPAPAIATTEYIESWEQLFLRLVISLDQDAKPYDGPQERQSARDFRRRHGIGRSTTVGPASLYRTI